MKKKNIPRINFYTLLMKQLVPEEIDRSSQGGSRVENHCPLTRWISLKLDRVEPLGIREIVS